MNDRSYNFVIRLFVLAGIMVVMFVGKVFIFPAIQYTATGIWKTTLSVSISDREYDLSVEINDRVEDTGIDNKEFFSYSEETKGKHYQLACHPGVYTETKLGYLYVTFNLRSPAMTDSTAHLFHKYPLAGILTDEILPDENMIIDGYLCGKIEHESLAGTVVTSPVLRLTGIAESGMSTMDTMAPLKSTAEPELSVEEEGVTLSVDKLEYREALNRVFMTIENNSDKDCYISNTLIVSGAEELSGLMLLGKYTPPSSLSAFIEDSDISVPLHIPPDTRQALTLVILPVTEDQPIDFTVEAYSAPENILDAESYEIITLSVSYPGAADAAEAAEATEAAAAAEE